jgi:hypothetical protein
MANDNTVNIPARSKPTTNPAADKGEVYHKSGTKKVYWLDEDGNEFDLTAAASVSNPVTIAQGGTGQTAKTAAFDALAPTTTTQNDRIIWDGTDYIARTPPRDSYVANEVSDYTTTSTSFVAVDATNYNLSITTNGGEVEIHFDGMMSHTAVAGRVYFDVYIDSTTYLGGDDGLSGAKPPSGDNFGWRPIAFTRRITGLSAAAHTFQLHWKTSGATATLYAGAGTTNADIHPEFSVKEF